MNNVDLVEKKDLFKVAEEFQNILGYEKRYFMILGLEGSGVKNFSQCFNGPSKTMGGRSIHHE
ncbi:BnaAnng11230D [Brassica napus]|uniref:(rape) hypothetical protein n=1 Tax=Brassica napus TaxID=3708 RepID=A0A078IQI9_BRANA|nr:unnamed protein product [Brassica napus]CDY52182.1 BnaAnng11230D [Brassica napus]